MSETTRVASCFISALLRQPTERRPVWLMRQAGRYLPEYRALRAQYPDFLTFCRTPQAAAEATLQPLSRFDLDAGIIFSDILVVLPAMGIPVTFQTGEGPIVPCPIRNLNQVMQLTEPNVSVALDYVMEAIDRVKTRLRGRVPLIGFAGSPWTVACYAIQGQGSKSFSEARSLAYQSPEIMHAFLTRLTEVTIHYLNAQVAAGADALMVFDSWGGFLTQPLYEAFSLAYLKRIAQSVTRSRDGQPIPLIFFTKGGGLWLPALADTGCDAVGIDWMTDIGYARQQVGERVALQGNLDPAILSASPDCVEREVRRILTAFGDHPGLVFNLGHGIEPSAQVENVERLIQVVHAYD